VTVVRIALAQLNPTVGDLEGNLAKLIEAYDRADAAGCDIVAFPELSITGYPPEDLVLKPGFVADNRAALRALRRPHARLRRRGRVRRQRPRHLQRGGGVRGRAVVGTYRKRLLPNYAVFDEARTFTPGNDSDPLELYEIAGAKVGISVCEDIWSPFGPLAEQAAGGAEVSININGSPYHWEKDAGRERMVATRAQDAHTAIVYVNQVGGQDELVFDGGSFVVDADGTLLARSPQFVEDLLVVDVPVRRCTATACSTRAASAPTPRSRSCTSAARAAGPTRHRSSRRSPSRSTPTPSCTRRSCSAPATTAARTASPTW
jgi:NAD+ synthase (glutamine-hydrolysing)